MNALILITLCCVVAGASAKLAWLPQMNPYSCVWCSARYYRKSPQALTTGTPAVGSASAQSANLALHAGWFYDIIPKQPVQDQKSACIYLVNMYRGNKGPVAADQIMSYINMSFYGPQQTKDYADKPHPLTFQCCHYKYGRQLMDQINTNENVDNVGSSTTEQSVSDVDVVSTTQVADDDTTTVVVQHKKKHLSGRSGVKEQQQKQQVQQNDDQNDRKKRQSDDDGEEVVKSTLKKRSNLRVPINQNVDSSVVVDNNNENADVYKAPMPQILPEGFTCNTLTYQLYMELSQDNVSRQKQIQKAMQQNVRQYQNNENN